MSYGFVGFSNWLAKKAYGNVWRLIPPNADRAITMTGSNVDTILALEAKHRIVRIELYHVHVGYDAASDSPLDILFYRKQGTVEDSPYHSNILWEETGKSDSFISQDFGEKKEYEASKWMLRLKSTNTEHVTVAVYVQIEGGN